jgi:hypothetical protein
MSSKTSTTSTTSLGYNALRKFGDYYIYAGYSTGFYTKINSATFTSTKTNSMVMKYLFDKDNSYACIYESEIQSGTLSSLVSNPSTTSYATILGSLTTTSSGGNLEYLSKYYAIYSSPYSGAFDLLDTMYIPRPCAHRSVNLTQMDYFYGQWAKTYDMRT